VDDYFSDSVVHLVSMNVACPERLRRQSAVRSRAIPLCHATGMGTPRSFLVQPQTVHRRRVSKTNLETPTTLPLGLILYGQRLLIRGTG